MLSGERIRQMLKASLDDPGEGIGCTPNPTNGDDSQIGAASLDVRLGSWFLVMHQSKRSLIDLSVSDGNGLENTDGKYYYVPFGETFIVHPNRFALGSTLEWLQFPNDVGGHITGKSSLGRRGLIIETAAGIQPGFTGCLTLEIYNAGEVPIAITPGMRIAQIFFHEVKGQPSDQVSQFRGKRKPVFGIHKAAGSRNLTEQYKMKI